MQVVAPSAAAPLLYSSHRLHLDTCLDQVVLVDLQASSPGAATGQRDGRPEMYPSEQAWINSAAQFADDMLWVAPVSDAPRVPAYPAALTAPANRLLAVAAVGCDGRKPGIGTNGQPQQQQQQQQRVDLLAPGLDITAATPVSKTGATLTLSAVGGGRGDKLALAVVLPGAGAGRPEALLPLAMCKGGTVGAGSGCPTAAGQALCVLPAAASDTWRAVCDVLSRASGCGGGIIVALAAGSPGPLPDPADLKQALDDCAPVMYGANSGSGAYSGSSSGGAGGGGSANARPPVLLANGNGDAGRLAAAFQAHSGGNSSALAGWLSVYPAQQEQRSGSAQAAAWVAGGAARLLAQYPDCNTSDVAAVLLNTAALLAPDGKPTGARGRGGLVQLADAESALAARSCGAQRSPAPEQQAAYRGALFGRR